MDQVRAEMKQCKISQTKLGQQTLISQAVVSQWLNRCYGGHNVKVDAAMKQWIEARRKGTVVEFDPDMPASILRPARAACTVAEKQARPPPWARGKQAGGTPPGPAPASSAGSKGAAGGRGRRCCLRRDRWVRAALRRCSRRWRMARWEAGQLGRLLEKESGWVAAGRAGICGFASK